MKTYIGTISEISLKKTKTEFKKVKITNSKDAADYIRQFYSDDIGIFESFFILLMNRANNTIGYAKISQGGVTGTLVDNVILTKYAIESLSSGVILAHNHPSGNLKPSKTDMKLTAKIKECLKLFDIPVLDHVILTEDGYYSMADEGIL